MSTPHVVSEVPAALRVAGDSHPGENSRNVFSVPTILCFLSSLVHDVTPLGPQI